MEVVGGLLGWALWVGLVLGEGVLVMGEGMLFVGSIVWVVIHIPKL